MKKLFLCSFATLLFLSFSSIAAFSATSSTPIPVPTTVSKSVDPAKSEKLTARLSEIKAIDKTGLNFSEKRVLRKETRSIKRELKQLSGGVYVSVGALILIAVLLIILL